MPIRLTQVASLGYDPTYVRIPPDSFGISTFIPDEMACARHLERIRWPEGFKCPSCGHVGEPWRLQARPRVLECRQCGKQVSLTAGTIMHRTQQPLPIWFWAAYLVTTQTPGMSALQFQKQLGIKRYETAFLMLHKLRAAMVRPGRDRIGAKWPQWR